VSFSETDIRVMAVVVLELEAAIDGGMKND
jgi:hypothetical protein